MEMKENRRLDIMLDLETCALSENAAILSVALVPFELDGGECEEKPLYYVIDGNSCYLEGMKYDECTQEWWQKQEPAAKAAILFDTKPIHIRTATMEIYDWLSLLCDVYEVHIWCRGLNFDLPKLEFCFRKFIDKNPPYKYYHTEDARTYCHAFGIHSSNFYFEGCRHSAADDCMFQIKQVQAARETYQKLIDCKKIVESQA